MKKYTVDEPEFNKTLIITETTDTGHADNINKAPEMAFENTLYLEKTKLDADGGDISEAVIKAADEIEDDEYPIPASGDKPRTFLGKTKKFLGNIKDWMTGVCLLGQIVNNCVTDNAKLPLSAAQGKVLMDLYNVLNTKMKISLESPDNWNDLWTESNTPFAFYSVTNAGKATGSPKECYAFGLLIVFTADISTYYSGWRNIQIYIEDSSNGNSDRGRIYIRSNNRDNTGWKLFTGSKIDLA